MDAFIHDTACPPLILTSRIPWVVMRQTLRSVGCLAAMFSLCVGYAGDAETGFDADHRKKAESLRHDSLRLTISLPKASFFLGELIPVTFRFEDKKDTKQYEAWTGGYDRSGRIPMEFMVDGPAGSFCDPLATYFASGIFMGGGIGNEAKLGSHEQVFHLNEWVRFERPGTYRFYTISSRVSQTKDNVGHSFPLVSPIVTIEIREPTTQELDATFREAVPASISTGPGSDDSAKVYAALSRLRYLDTAASRRHLRGLLERSDGANTTAKFGLIGTRDPNATIALLEEGITNPEVANTTEYFNALQQLRLIRSNREQNGQKVPPGTTTTPTLSWPRMDYFGNRADWKKLAVAFEHKTGRARAVCASSLFEFIKNEQRQDKAEAEARAKGVQYLSAKREHLDYAAVLRQIRGPLAETLLQLTDNEQALLLRDSWELIRCPELIQPLRKIVEAPMKSRDTSFSSGIRSLAALRLSDLDRDFGRQHILEDLRRKEPRYSLEVLCSLPADDLKKELPLLASRFGSPGVDLEKVAGIIDHIADDSIYDDVKRHYLNHEGRWACLIQSHCLAYFIKVHRAKGLDLAFRAMTFREEKHSHCYASVASEVLAPHYAADVESRLLKILPAEMESDVITDLTRVLLEHGTEAVIDPLLDVVERLSSKAINDNYSYSTEAGARHHVVEGLMRAGAKSDGRARWKLTPLQQERLKSCLATDQEKKEFERDFKAD